MDSHALPILIGLRNTGKKILGSRAIEEPRSIGLWDSVFLAVQIADDRDDSRLEAGRLREPERTPPLEREQRFVIAATTPTSMMPSQRSAFDERGAILVLRDSTH